MPNHKEKQVAHTNNYYLSFPDGSLTKKLLDFKNQEEKKWTDERLDREIKQKVYEFLKGSSPHYYQGKQTPTDFNVYKDTPDGIATIKIIKEELFFCLNRLSKWAELHKLELSGTQGTAQNVSSEFLYFLQRLINGVFSDRTSLFYADGKKSIEILTLLIQDESIDLTFRQNQLINLVADRNLELCADGCFSRFMLAADALKNFGDLSFSSLMQKFVLYLAEKAERTSIENKDRHAKALCEKLKISPQGNEIHAKNYLINRLLTELGLSTLIIKDNFVQLFKSNNPELKKAIDHIYQEFQKNFNNEFRAVHLVEFIIEQYYLKEDIHFSSGKFFSSNTFDSTKLQDFLNVLGKDNDFTLNEVLSFDEEGRIHLKSETALVVTLTERLLNEGWFDLDKDGRYSDKYRVLKEISNEFNLELPKNEETLNLRVFIGNFALSWITDEEGNRITLPYCLEKITNCLSLLKEKFSINILNNLLENSDDLIDFFKQLPLAEHGNALDWLVEKGFNLHICMFNKLYLSKYLDSKNPLFSEYYKLTKKFNQLFSTLSESSRVNLIQRFNLHDKVSELLSNNVEQLEFVDSPRHVLPYMIEFIQWLKKSGFNFKNFVFNKAYSNLDGSDDEIKYLDKIDFSNANLEDTVFNPMIENCNFEASKLKNLDFLGGVRKVNFKKIEGNININEEVVQCDFSHSRSNLNINGDVVESLFKGSGTIKIFGDILNSPITDFSGEFTLVGAALESSFENFSGVMKIKQHLENVGINNAHGEYLEIEGEIDTCNLNKISFEKIKITGKITNSFLTSIDFRDAMFIDEQGSNSDYTAHSNKILNVKFKFDKNEEGDFEAFFKDSQFSTQSLTRFLEHPSITETFWYENQYFPLLQATDLSEVDFQSAELMTALKKFKLLDFSRVNLQFRNFDHFLQDEKPLAYQLNFEGAKLRGSSFDRANLYEANLQAADLRECDLSTANIKMSDVSRARIDNIQLNGDQLFHFYERGHRDFSTLRLVGNLENVESLSLVGTKLSSLAFEHLIEQGFKNFAEVDLTAVSREIIRKYHRREDISFEKARLPTEKRALSLSDCLEGGSVKKAGLRKKREIICLFDEEDINEFSNEDEHGKRKIDSERFLRLFSTVEKEAQAQLIEFANLLPIVGTKQVEVQKIKEFEQWQLNLNRAGQVAGLATKGLIYKQILISFLNGQYNDTAINLGLMGQGHFLSHFSEELESLGEAYLFEGKNLLGNVFKAASPFFKRSTSAFMVYDLVEAVKELNSGDSTALLRVAGDSINIGLDVVETGIEIAEVFEIFESVSVFTGPIAGIIGGLCFLGTDIYQAVRRVKQIDKMLHLTGWETFREGLRAFLGMSMEEYLKESIDEQQFYEFLIKQKFEFLKRHPTIKNIFFPTEHKVCHKVQYLEAEKWPGDKPRRRLIDVCDQSVEDSDSILRLDKPKKIRAFGREKPEIPEVGDLLCFPPGIGGYAGISYICENLIGITDPNPNKATNNTFISLGVGDDLVSGFLDSPNIMLASDGFKRLTGGNQNDTFILQGNLIYGFIDGGKGVNALDLTNFSPYQHLQINSGLKESYLVNKRYGYKSFNFINIQHIFGRKKYPDHMSLGCRITSVDSRGGNFNFYDNILINNDQGCRYQMQLSVHPYTRIINKANSGDFSYLINQGNGNVEIHFESHGKDTAHHKISFDFTWLETYKIQFLPDNKVFFNLISESRNEQLNLTLIRGTTTTIAAFFTDHTEIKIGKEKTYTLRQTNETLTIMTQEYPFLAERFHGTIVAHSNNQTLVVGAPFHHEVLQNDPFHPSHLIGNGGENIYKIISTMNDQPIPEVTLYQLQPNSTQVETLDLRKVAQKIERNWVLCYARLSIRKESEDLHLLLKTASGCPFNENYNLKVILKDAVKTFWVHRLNILIHQSIWKINSFQGKSRLYWKLTAEPLIFDNDKKIVVLTAKNVESHTQVMFPKMPEGFILARTGVDLQDLIIVSNEINAPRTVIIKGFFSATGYDVQRLRTLSLKFGNETLNLHTVDHKSLLNLTSIQTKKKDQIYKPIFGETSSDATIRHRVARSAMLLETTRNAATSNGMLIGLTLIPVAVVGNWQVIGRQISPVILAAAVFLSVTSLPRQADAMPVISNTEMLTCYTPPFKIYECTISQFQSGELGYCANSATELAWFREKTGSMSYVISDSVKSKASSERLFFSQNDLYFLHSDQCQQRISLEIINLPIQTQNSFVQQFLTLVAQQKRIKQYQNEVAAKQFKQAANTIIYAYLAEQSLVHSYFGNYFRVIGLKPNWQQRDVSYWMNRMMKFCFSRHGIGIGAISGVCLETALLHPLIQSTLPGDTYQGKLVIRFIADLLQFGANVSTFIPALLGFLCYQHPWSYELMMGLRASLAMLEVMNDPSSWYLILGLFILPQLPLFLENIGIPVTRCISHTLEMLERFLVSYSLFLSVQEDSKRLKIKEIDLKAADRRVSKAQERMLAVYDSGVRFFSNSRAFEGKNDAKFCNPTDNAKGLTVR